jgi:ABC-type sugar transport system substrate-binding protein
MCDDKQRRENLFGDREMKRTTNQEGAVVVCPQVSLCLSLGVHLPFIFPFFLLTQLKKMTDDTSGTTTTTTTPTFVADFLAFLPPGLHPGMDALARGLAMGIHQQGGQLRIRAGHDQTRLIEAALMETPRVVTMIFVFVTDPHVPGPAVAKALDAGIQVYSLHRPLYPVTASVIVPNFYQGTLLANRLTQEVLKHKTDSGDNSSTGRIAMLGGPKILDDEELVLGCLDGLKRLGMTVLNDPMEDKYRNLTDLKGESLGVMEVLMKDTYPFDGLVVFNDETLHDVIEYLQEKKLIGKFPIVSRNGSPQAIEWVRQGLTTATMDYNLPELGMIAANLIVQQQKDGFQNSPNYVMGPAGTVYDADNVDNYVDWSVRAPPEYELKLVES